jgi:hypothetical protein
LKKKRTISDDSSPSTAARDGGHSVIAGRSPRKSEARDWHQAEGTPVWRRWQAREKVMLVVTVYLDSAIHSSRSKELARMHICNVDDGSEAPGMHRYEVTTLRGRSKEELDKRIITRQGKVGEVPSDEHHVWYLVGEALKAVKYDKRPKRSHKSA